MCPPLVWKLGLCLTWAVQVLTVAVSAHVQLSICVHCVFITILHLGVLQSFQPHFWNYPSALGRGRGCDRDVQFRIQYFMVLHFLYLYQVWASVLISFYYKKKLLWLELRSALIYVHSNKSLGGGLVLCSLDRIIVISSPLGPVACIATGSFPR